MKKIYAFLFLSIFAFGFSSDSPYRYLKIIDNQVVFQKVYEMEGLSESDVERLLTSNTPKVKNLTEFRKYEGVITARLNEADIDLTKYGLSVWSNYDALLNHPLFCDVSIDWKEGKYRVTLSSLLFKAEGLGDITGTDAYCKILKKGNKEWSTVKNRVKGGLLLERYLSDLFDFSTKTQEDW